MLVTLVIYEAAYLAEIVRAGIEALPKGQMEAARCASGLRYMQAMRKVILPQALYNMVPAMLSQFVSTIKETSLGYVISVNELTFAANQINSTLLTKPFQVFVILAVIYFLLCFTLTPIGSSGDLEKRAGAPPARGAASGAAAAPVVLPNHRGDRRMSDPMIQFEGVNKWYGNYHALQDINADRREGRGGRGLRPVGLGQVDADPHREPAGGDPEGNDRVRRAGRPRAVAGPQSSSAATSASSSRASTCFRICPSPSNIMLAPTTVKGRDKPQARERGDGAAGARRPGRQGRCLPGPALGRPAAARGHRARAGDGTRPPCCSTSPPARWTPRWSARCCR